MFTVTLHAYPEKEWRWPKSEYLRRFSDSMLGHALSLDSDMSHIELKVSSVTPGVLDHLSGILYRSNPIPVLEDHEQAGRYLCIPYLELTKEINNPDLWTDPDQLHTHYVKLACWCIHKELPKVLQYLFDQTASKDHTEDDWEVLITSMSYLSNDMLVQIAPRVDITRMFCLSELVTKGGTISTNKYGDDLGTPEFRMSKFNCAIHNESKFISHSFQLNDLAVIKSDLRMLRCMLSIPRFVYTLTWVNSIILGYEHIYRWDYTEYGQYRNIGQRMYDLIRDTPDMNLVEAWIMDPHGNGVNKTHYIEEMDDDDDDG